MKALVVYFTRTGNTEKVAKFMAEKLSADIEQITEKKDRSGVLGYIGAGRDAIKKKGTPINECKYDSSQYDIVLIGTPIWAYTMTPPILSYLEANSSKFLKVAYFCTHGGNHGETFDHMETAGGKPSALLEIRDKSVKTDEFKPKVESFLEKL